MDRSTFASSHIITALLPPNSSNVLPNLLCTLEFTILPTFVLPVKETRGILSSFSKDSPISTPPHTSAKTPLGHLLASKTEPINLVQAMLTKFVEGAPFQMLQLPQIAESAKFQPITAAGKLKAVIIPTKPKGFHYSIMKWSGRSEGNTCPAIDRERPQAKSQMSMISWISPSPSA